MVRKAIVLASLFAAAAPAPALAQDVYYVRNETPRAFTCGLRRPHGKIDRFVLRSGQDWTQTTAGGRGRTLLCDSRPLHTQHFRMRSGVRYALVDHEGEILLRPIEPAP